MTGSEKGKWTPGPWIAEFHDGPNCESCNVGHEYAPQVHVFDANRNRLIGSAKLSTHGHYGGDTPEVRAETEANALLISKAPELAEALRELVEDADGRDVPGVGACLVTQLSINKARTLLSSLSGEAF